MQGLFNIASSWYIFWSFGSFADVGVSLFTGTVSGVNLLRTGMYRAAGNVFDVKFDIAPRPESMMCYLDDTVNAIEDVLN